MRDRIRCGKRGVGETASDWIWMIGSVVVLALGLHGSRLPSLPAAFQSPETPLDRTAPHGARLWIFLVKAREFVPPGASYTVLAADSDDEMSLFMFSLGILLRQRALPTSYFGVNTRRFGDAARFVLVYGGVKSGIARARLVRTVVEGEVYERLPA